MKQYLTINELGSTPRFLIPVNNILSIKWDGSLQMTIHYKASEPSKITRLTLLFISAVGGSDISVAEIILPLYITKLLASDNTTMSVPLIAISSAWLINN